jgi:hypothetical protein
MISKGWVTVDILYTPDTYRYSTRRFGLAFTLELSNYGLRIKVRRVEFDSVCTRIRLTQCLSRMYIER